jgi:glycosyltransferase involved in cell wall biosynthesis
MRSIYSGLKELRNASLNSCDSLAVLSEDMKSHLVSCNVRSHIDILPNWAIQAPSQEEPAAMDLRREWGIGDRFVLGYSGNLGRAHDVDTFLAAAPGLVELDGLTMLFIGGGAGLKALKESLDPATGEQSLFLPYQPREILAASLQVPDVHWFSLIPEMNAHVFPSKFYGILQSGRPIVFIGDPESELARMIEDRRCGFVVAPGNAAALLDAVTALYKNSGLREEMGRNARRLNDEVTNRLSSLARWECALAKLRSINDL